MEDVLALAKEAGFDLFATICADDVVTDELLAQSCNPGNCRKYASCWSCPPGAGSYEERQAHFEGKNAGVIVQTVREGVDHYEDFELLADTKQTHNERLDRLAAEIRRDYPDALAFSTGGCDVCDSCSYPDAPCKRPAEQRLSLSAHGVSVGGTCKKAGLEYSFENGRIRYVGMVLYSAVEE